MYNFYIEDRLVFPVNADNKSFLSKEDLRLDFIEWVQKGSRQVELLANRGKVTCGDWLNKLPLLITGILSEQYGQTIVTKKRKKKNGLINILFPTSTYLR